MVAHLLYFNNHIKVITKSPFHHLKNTAKQRDFMSEDDLEILIHVFISRRLDYCNGFFTGLLKKIHKATSTDTKCTEHVTPLVKSLRWLPVCYKIKFKALLLVYKSLNVLGPDRLTCFSNADHQDH